MGMVETKVPKNIKKYKAKVVGNMFTARQLLCATVAVVVDLSLLPLLKMITTEKVIIGIVLFIIDLLIISFCFEMDGLYLDQYVYKVIIPSFKNPSKRYVIKESGERNNTVQINKRRMKKKRDELYKEHPELKPIR